MIIAVPVKQVPQVASLRFEPKSGRTVRRDVPLVLNAYDRRALGEALRLRRGLGGEVVVLTVGPADARKALEECLALGADRAIHVCDEALAGGDTLATARALAAAIRPLVANLVICGQRSVDAETSQVGPALAELLDLPQVTAAVRVTPSEDGRTLDVERLSDEGREVLRVPLPCLLTAAERLHRPEAGEPPPVLGDAPIETRTLADLDVSPTLVGAAGSTTRVHGTRHVEVTRRREILEGSSAVTIERLAAVVVAAMHASAVAYTPRSHHPRNGQADRSMPASDPRRFAESSGDILVVAERLHDGAFRPSTFGLIGRAAHLAGQLGGRTLVLLAGPSGVRERADELREAGADLMLLAEHPSLRCYRAEPYAWLLAGEIRCRQLAAVLFPATDAGRDLAPRVAARLGLGLVSDCEDVRVESDHRLTFVRPSLGGTVLADVETLTRPALATVWQADYPPRRRGHEGGQEHINITNLPPSRTTLLESYPDARASLVLDQANVIVGVGSGIGGPEHLAEITRLASALGGAVGATRKVVDLGWLPPQQQIGLSGRRIAPRLYLAIGARGSFNHAIGIRRAGTIVAINRDVKAEVFKECDLGVVADWREIVPALSRQVTGDALDLLMAES